LWSREKRKKLQWGHVFSDVEIATMSNLLKALSGFNGATSFQTWKFGAKPRS